MSIKNGDKKQPSKEELKNMSLKEFGALLARDMAETLSENIRHEKQEQSKIKPPDARKP